MFHTQAKTRYSCMENQFMCKNKECIAMVSVCNGIEDCQSGEDEQGCSCNGTSAISTQNYESCLKLPANETTCQSFSFVCPGEKCIPGTFVCDGKADCNDKSDEFCKKEYWSVPRPFLGESYNCTSGEKIPRKYVNDLIPDCPGGDDEIYYLTVMQDRTLYQQRCKHEGMLPCEFGTNVCFFRYELC